MDINKVLHRLRSGDRHGFAAVVAHYQGPLFAFLGRMGLPRGNAEEIAQETFVRAWQNLGNYQEAKAAFSTWLFTIARNLALHELQSASWQREQEMLDPLEEFGACGPSAAYGEAGEGRSDLATPETLLQVKQRQQRLHRALRRLTPEERALVALAYVHELAMADIARIEACSVGAAKTRLHRIRLKLAEFLGTEND